MTRIYFDSNVFSKLRQNDLPQYNELNRLLELYKSNLSFFFSQAHVRDKKKDSSPIKYDDFRFMESFTTDNYLSYHALDKNTTFYLATPLMAFEDDETDITGDLSSIFKVFEPAEDDDPLVSVMKTFTTQHLFKTPLDLGVNLSGLEIPFEQRELLEKILPSGQTLTMGSFIDNFSAYMVAIHTDHETYRELRRMIDTGINNGKITVKDNSADFNEALKDTEIQKTFIDFVMQTSKTEGDDRIPYYDFYLKAYNALDFLGISKDKITRKNNYYNLFNDGLHSYYARYFDYLVTEDSSLYEKSKALYNLFEVHTQVVSVTEFIELLPQIAKDTEADLLDFFSKLYSDLRHESQYEIEGTEDGSLRYIKTGQTYVNTFDALIEAKQDQLVQYLLYERRKNLLSGANYRETGMVIAKLLQLLGTDILNVGPFDFDKEVEQIRKDEWEGRFWKIGTLLFHLHNNDGLKTLTLSIRPHVSK